MWVVCTPPRFPCRQRLLPCNLYAGGVGTFEQPRAVGWPRLARHGTANRGGAISPVQSLICTEGIHTESQREIATAGNTDGEFIVHLLQEPFRISSILIRLERATQAFNCVSFSGVMVIQ
jgi:hypothetical protein